jgi:hypothetical protein
MPTDSHCHAKSAEEFTATFGLLQDSFGFGGVAPVVTPPSSKQSPKPSAASVPHALANKSESGKDYATAAADLQSSFGFVGGASSHAIAADL